jgi:hypothetical protein
MVQKSASMQLNSLSSRVSNGTTCSPSRWTFTSRPANKQAGCYL